MAKLARVLKTDIMGDLTALAELLQSKGRDGDSILAHISPKEAKKLKQMGGRGTKNPDTGLLEFADTPELSEVTVTAHTPDYFQPVAQPTQLYYGNQVTPEQAQSYTQPDYYFPTSVPMSMGTAQPTGTVLPQSPIAGGFKAAQIPDELTEITPTVERLGEPKEALWKRGVAALGGVGGLAQLGITGLLGLQGQKMAREAAKQSQQYAAQQQAMALPYQVSGQRMATAAERGELTPASRQAYEAARAGMAQAAEARGGVAVAQSATQLEAFRQSLLDNQYRYGLQVANIGDNIALGAIRTGMQADQYVNQATMQFYSLLGNFAAQNWRSPQTTQKVPA